MNRTTLKRSRREQQKQANKTLMIAFVVLLFIGVFAQIAMIARLSGQNKHVRSVEGEIRDLKANAENLSLCLSQYGDLDRVAARAAALGMQKPGEGQIRVVNLPELADDTSAQNAVNAGVEEMKE